MAKKKVRVLVGGSIGGVNYQPNDVVSLPEALAKQHAEAVDPNKEAIAYALSINGGKVKEHVEAAAEEGTEATAQAVIAEPDSPLE
jgi:hypothetical protein